MGGTDVPRNIPLPTIELVHDAVVCLLHRV